MIAGPLTDEYVRATCQPGKGALTCRYLLMTARDGWLCGKHTEHRVTLDRRVATETINARGDNCEGFPAP